MTPSYHEERTKSTTLKIRELMKELPPFMPQFFRGIADKTSALTRLAYAYDFRIFFKFLKEETIKFADIPTTEFSLENLGQVDPNDIEDYMEYLNLYLKASSDGSEAKLVEIQNAEQGKYRKLSSLRSMFAYFFKKRSIPYNPGELVDLPKLHQKKIIRLDIDEVARLLDEVESGEQLTKRQQAYHNYTKARDLAIVTLMLGTGIRISECVGIDLQHLDFNNNAILITRKGGNQSTVYFGDEVLEALTLYLKERKDILTKEGHENALFLSLQRKRINVRSVQKLVEKYASIVTPLKNITPHKLRSTYGTNLYRETGDIYLVADVLGHADINTTKKHYAEMDDERRKSAPKYVKLRRD